MNMSLVRYLFILGIIIVLSAGATVVYYTQTRIVAVKEFDLVGYVGNRHGLGFNGSQILFGMVLPGGHAWRRIKLEN
ncbi:hypothetical protein DRJ48_01965, partial [Candidatus Woesearchaeota archaeon]